MSSTALPIAHYLGAGLAGATITALGYSLTAAYAARSKRTPVRVLITGAAGHIPYALAPLIARGLMLGPETPIILHLYDKPVASNVLQAVRLELLDMALPLLLEVVVAVDLAVACRDVEVAIMVGGFSQKQGMTRKEAFREIVDIYAAQGAALEKYANRHVRVVIVANPANTSALILKEMAPSIPAENITALTRLDHNRALALLADKAFVPVKTVRNAVVWGNHSSTQVPDLGEASVGGRNAFNVIKDEDWLDQGVVNVVRQRSASIVQKRNMSPAASAASAICDHVRDWLIGTRRGEWVSMGVMSNGSYGIPEGICFSFPVACHEGQWTIVNGLRLDQGKQEKLDRSLQELLAERQIAYQVLQEAWTSGE